MQLPPQPLRGLLPISLLGEQRHDGCEQFAQDSDCDFNSGLLCLYLPLCDFVLVGLNNNTN